MLTKIYKHPLKGALIYINYNFILLIILYSLLNCQFKIKKKNNYTLEKHFLIFIFFIYSFVNG